MANEVCVFCGQKLGAFRSASVQCAGTFYDACKDCEKELNNLDEVEICKRALDRGIVENSDRLKERIEVISEAENHRPKCLRCGASLSFMKVQALDNTPLKDSVYDGAFGVLPAYCESCGKYEFYNPEIVQKNKHLAYLISKDINK